jgi:hypothetical protein
MLEEEMRWEEGHIRETPLLPAAAGDNSEEWDGGRCWPRVIGFTPVPPESDMERELSAIF